ncbi:MAG: plasmid maintenance system killer [Rhodospirillaceae bacterium]|nr:plasmid maintenance system killer [Rhodospirillaceae bacterium]
MVIGSVRHRGFRRLLENDSPRLLKHHLPARARNILTALVLADDIDELVAHAPPGWRVHRLVGDRRNVWSISVSGNWRITFEERNGAVERLDLEDYH